MNRYSLNANPIVSVDFVDGDGAAADPTAVALVVTKPDATTATYTNATLDNPAVGTWSKTLVADQSGTWAYAFTGTGAVAATSAGRFSVGPEPITDDVVAVLGRELSDSEIARFDRLTEMAYAMIEANLPGFAIAAGTAIDERIVHDDPGVAWTARYPVSAVTEVNVGDAVLSETSYRWTETGRIELGQRCILNEFEVNLGAGYNFGEDLTVTYEYGMADPAPDEVLTVVAQMVAGVLRNQATNPDGVTSTRLGAFEESYGPQGNPGFASLGGSAALLRRWARRSATSVPLVRRR